MKYLVVGDIHAKTDDLAECEKLFEFFTDLAYKNGIQNVILLGDLHDSHSLISSQVLNFYHNQFTKRIGADVTKGLRFICLVGNHDIVLRDRSKHALIAYKHIQNVTIVDRFMTLYGIDFMPYTDNSEFYQNMSLAQSDTLVCHHTFDGAQYENGFYAKDGIDLTKVPHQKVFSGHIHTVSQVGKCKYVGAPRWLTKSDANQDRGVWIWDTDENSFEFFSTEDVCCKIVELKIDAKSADLLTYSTINNEIKPNRRVILNVAGDYKQIKEIVRLFGNRAEIVPILTEAGQSHVSEAFGIDVALKDFILNKYQMKYSKLTNEQLYNKIINKLDEITQKSDI